ncbi:MAG: SRPBCC family protein [Cyclobacteriaceae bacterium]|nr:SRPBCC family protein [Cyclobacteriaceae bacterium]
MTKIELSTHINAPIERCFDLARSIELYTNPYPAHEGPQAKQPEARTGVLEPGQRIQRQFTYLGAQHNIETEITRCSRPYFFSEEMKAGPLHTFVHDHFFYGFPGETIMIDNVYFRSPWGVLGETADTLLLKRYITRLLKKRNQIIKHYVETGKWQMIIPSPEVVVEEAVSIQA